MGCFVNKQKKVNNRVVLYMAIHHGCEDTQTSMRELFMVHIMDVSTHPEFKEGTLHGGHHGCEHTQTSKRKPYMVDIMGVSTPRLQFTSKREPYMVCIVGVSAPILQRERYMVHVTDVSTPRLQKGNLTWCTSWV